MLTEWQVYRMFEARRGAWSTFQFLVRERLLELGVEVAAGRLDPRIEGSREPTPPADTSETRWHNPCPQTRASLTTVVAPSPALLEEPPVDEVDEGRASDARSAQALRPPDRRRPRCSRGTEERELARRKDAGDEAAKRRLIECNLRLVMSMTRNYRRPASRCSI